jgi:hypothetical protein
MSHNKNIEFAGQSCPTLEIGFISMAVRSSPKSTNQEEKMGRYGKRSAWAYLAYL